MTTPQELADDWAQMETYAANGDVFAECVLDLRNRLDALAATVAPVNAKSSRNLTQVRSSLVDRLAVTLHAMTGGDPDLTPYEWQPEARAAITQIAADLELDGYHGAAGWLRFQLSTPAASRQEDFNG